MRVLFLTIPILLLVAACVARNFHDSPLKIARGNEIVDPRDPVLKSTVAIVTREAVQHCSGTYIGNNFVVSAAHCYSERGDNRLAAFVVFGENVVGGSRFEIDAIMIHGDYRLRAESTKQSAAVQASHQYQNAQRNQQYDEANNILFERIARETSAPINDIALLHFTGTVPSFAEPVNLPLFNQSYDTHTEVIQAGFGNTQGNDGAGTLLKATNNLGAEKSLSLEFLVEAGPKGEDACRGDSGGPLFLVHKSQGHTLIGVFSRGIRHPRDCGKSGAVYTDLRYFLNWLDCAKRDILNATPCSQDEEPRLRVK